jgi:hypothetical protein
MSIVFLGVDAEGPAVLKSPPVKDFKKARDTKK